MVNKLNLESCIYIVHCQSQRSRRGQPGSSRGPFAYAMWPLNSRGRTPAQNLMHRWGQRSCKGHFRCQSNVNLLRNALWPPNMVRGIPGHCTVGSKVMQRSSGVNQWLIYLEMFYRGYQIWLTNSLPERNASLGLKVMQESAEVNQRLIFHSVTNFSQKSTILP